MSIKVVTEFLQGSTIWIRAYVYTAAGVLVDPTAITVTLLDSAGAALIDAAAMTKDGENTGVYDYYKNTSSSTTAGQYRGKVVVVDGDGETAKTSQALFTVDVLAGLFKAAA